MTTTETRTIPLNELAHCPDNSRRVKPSAGEHAELVASIQNHGLLENLVVRAMTDANGTFYEVVAGARRFEALASLHKTGELAADYPVPCSVLTNGADVGEISLAENVVRVAMHPADQVAAFCRLHEQGSTVEKIANRFGVTGSLVEKRIRLGGVAPMLLKAFRDGKIDLSTVMAFTVTEDHKRQVAVYKQLTQGGRVAAWAVKRALTDEKVPADSKVARYVGIAAYEKAGGTVTRDLFADEHMTGVYIDDPALIERLAVEKLEKTAAKLRKQWKWADVVLEDVWETTHSYDRVFPKPGEATEAEAKELARLEAEYEAEDADRPTLEAQHEKIREAIARREVWSDEQLAVAGCVLTIGHDGKADVAKGYVKPEDRAAARKVEGTREGTGTGTGKKKAAEARKDAGVSAALADDLAAIRTTLVKVELLNKPAVAQDLLTFQMIRSVLFNQTYLGPDALDVKGTVTSLRPIVRLNEESFVESSPGEPVLQDEGQRLRKKYEWIKVNKPGDVYAVFQKFRKQKPETKAAVLAYCVASTVQNQLAMDPHAAPALEAAVAEIKPGFKLARPSKEVLWKRVSKATMVGVLTEIAGEEYAAAQGSKKKGELADYMERLFANPSADEFELTAEARKRVSTWAPIGFEPTATK